MLMDTDRPAQENQSNYYNVIFRLSLIIALASAVTVAVTYFDVLKLSGRFDSRYLILAVILQFLFWFLSSYTWQQVVKSVSGTTLPFPDCFSQNALLLVSKYIPGKVWGIIIRGHRLKKFNIDISVSMHATYLELLSSIHAGFVFGISCWLIASNHDWRWLAIIAGITSIFLLPVVHGSMMKTVIAATPDKWRPTMQGYTDINFPMREYLSISLLYLGEWLLLGGIAVCVFAAMTGEMVTIQISLILAGSNAVGMVAGFLALFAPAGIGVREVVNGGMLLSSLPISEITALVILLRCWHVATDLVIGGVALVLVRGDSG